SSFGISGTNAHVILAEAPTTQPAAEDEATDGTTDGSGRLDGAALPWTLSARSADALAETAGRLAEYVRARPELRPADVAFSLAAKRSAFESRAVVPGAEGRDGLLAGLDALA
ncbi:modular polyketide synthase, partial [Streptomyces sp. SID6041]|nr:modular polyketide synthase [Streptomyces sp. SID6041]